MLAGNPAVPCNIPRKRSFEGRIPNIIKTTGARYYLITESQFKLSGNSIEQNASPYRLTALLDDGNTNTLASYRPVEYNPSSIAFIQFTSGSTQMPRGAIITHDNLRSCMNGMVERWNVSQSSVFGTWLPQFHDLGLIYGLLLPLFVGAPVVTMRPAAFMQRPQRWLEMMDLYRCTHTAAPSFAYQHCVDKISDSDLASYNLQSLRMAMNAAEPISPSTIKAFSQKFKPCGFKDHMFTPAYGLAESTLAVTGATLSESPVVISVSDKKLRDGLIERLDGMNEDGRALVSSGKPLRDVILRIKEPKTFVDLAEDLVGEVWLSGAYITHGYYNDAASSDHAFPCLDDAGSGTPTRWLRTKDLGFLHDGELFITGRSDDVLIVAGKNYYPQDIEWIAQSLDLRLRNNCGAAVGLTSDYGDQVVLVQEVERDVSSEDLDALAQQIYSSILSDLELVISRTVFIEFGSIPRTSSGKIQRGSTKKLLDDKRLRVVHERSFIPTATSKVKSEGNSDPYQLWIARWIASYHGMQGESNVINRILKLGRIDLDSRGSAELVNKLEAKIGRNLPDTLIWDYPTIDLLVDFLDGLDAV